MDDTELDLLRSTVGHLLAADPAGVVPALAEAGWADIVAADPLPAIRVLFEEKGRSLSAAPLLDDLVLASLGLPDVGGVGYVVREWAGPAGGPAVVASAPVATASGPLAVLDLPADGSVRASVVAGWTATPLEGLDPDVELVAVDAPPGEPVAVDPALRHRVRIAQAAELLGCAAEMLRIVLDHVTERRQFGRPIGEFQAVKHRLATCYVAQEAARSATRHAVDHESTHACEVARGLAGRAALTTSWLAPHVMGATGFLWETPVHRYLKRITVTDAVLGPWELIAEDLGRSALEAGAVPRLASA